ncbi:MAG: type II toxin-antitoxin system RelE/ParE family toxin, partial [Planctomycetota bacterium]
MESSQARVELTQRALTDIRGIENYSVTRWGCDVAAKYLEDITAALDRLSESPAILRLEPDFAPGLGFYRVRKHFLVCAWYEERIIVLTVIHTSMDLPSRLRELVPQLIAEAQLLQNKLH